MATHSTTFDGSESPLSESGAFADGPGGWGASRKVSGIHCPVSADTDAGAMSNSSFGAAQYSKATWSSATPTSGGSGDWHGVFTRMASSSDGDCYALARDPSAGDWKLYEVSDTGTLSFVELVAWTGTFAANDIIELRSNGSTHEGFRNGASLGSTTDASYATGNVGPSGYDISTVDTTHGWTAWEGGDIATPLAPLPPPPRVPLAVLCR